MCGNTVLPALTILEEGTIGLVGWPKPVNDSDFLECSGKNDIDMPMYRGFL